MLQDKKERKQKERKEQQEIEESQNDSDAASDTQSASSNSPAHSKGHVEFSETEIILDEPVSTNQSKVSESFCFILLQFFNVLFFKLEEC